MSTDISLDLGGSDLAFDLMVQFGKLLVVGTAAVVLPGVGGPLASALLSMMPKIQTSLSLLAGTCKKMDGINGADRICRRLQGKMDDIAKQLETMAKGEQIPDNAQLAIEKFLQALDGANQVMAVYAKKNSVAKMLTYRRLLDILEEYRDDLDHANQMLLRCYQAENQSRQKQILAMVEDQKRQEREQIVRDIEDNKRFWRSYVDSPGLMKDIQRFNVNVSEAMIVAQYEAHRHPDSVYPNLHASLVRQTNRRLHAELPSWYCSPDEIKIDPKDPFAMGSYGSVYHAIYKRSKVVVKRLEKSQSDPSLRQQFLQEITIWSRLQHPHIIPFIKACNTGPYPFIVCEKGTHGTILNFLKSKKASKTALELILEAGQGLAYLHDRRIVHGDMKGDNILISDGPIAKIADFGCSFEANSAPLVITGATRWQAPEVVQGRAPSVSSDIYSFGMTMIEIFSGRPPYHPDVLSESDVVKRIVSGALPKRPDSVSDAIWALITSMCHSDPDSRPSMDKVLDHLDHLLPIASDPVRCLQCGVRCQAENTFCECGQALPSTSRRFSQIRTPEPVRNSGLQVENPIRDSVKVPPAPEASPLSKKSFPKTKQYHVGDRNFQIWASFGRSDGAAFMELSMKNRDYGSIERCALQFNDNFIGVMPAGPVQLRGPIAHGASGSAILQLQDETSCVRKGRHGFVQMAIKTNLGISYFVSPFPPHVLFAESGHISPQNYFPKWQSIDSSHEKKIQIPATSPEAFCAKLSPINVIAISTVQNPTKGPSAYMALRLKKIDILFEAAFSQSETSLTFKSSDDALSTCAMKAIEAFLQQCGDTCESVAQSIIKDGSNLSSKIEPGETSTIQNHPAEIRPNPGTSIKEISLQIAPESLPDGRTGPPTTSTPHVETRPESTPGITTSSESPGDAPPSSPDQSSKAEKPASNQPESSESVPAPQDPAARFQQLCERYDIGAEFSVKLRLLSDFEIVVVADDSSSMSSIQKSDDPFGPIESRWDVLKRSLFQIIDIALLFDQNGIDVYFLNRAALDQQRAMVLRNVTERKTIEEAFVSPPAGFTPLTRTLKLVLDEKRTVIKEKKLLLIVCTDGEPTDEFGRVDIDAFRRLLCDRDPIDHIYVNVMACSDDPGTMAYLAKLDRQIANLDVISDYRSEKREITTTRPGVSYSYGDHIVKTLVGAIDPSLDQLDERCSCCAVQ